MVYARVDKPLIGVFQYLTLPDPYTTRTCRMVNRTERVNRPFVEVARHNHNHLSYECAHVDCFDIQLLLYVEVVGHI